MLKKFKKSYSSLTERSTHVGELIKVPKKFTITRNSKFQRTFGYDTNTNHGMVSVVLRKLIGILFSTCLIIISISDPAR
jgi:hypothetical protein